MDRGRGSRWDGSRLVWGTALAVIGVALLLDRVHWIELGRESRFWPLALIAVGLADFLGPRQDDRRNGLWVSLLGVWLLAHTLHVFRIPRSWPLVLAVIGVVMVWDAFRPPRLEGESREVHHGR